MEELEKNIVGIFREEHQDWVEHLKSAEESGEGIDINLGGNFAHRLERLLTALRDFRIRQEKGKKKRFF